MRQGRIKIDPLLGEAVYHCRSRTVNGEWLFDEPAREILRRLLWLVADFCGVEIVTYTILSNHYHVLLRVPTQTPVPDVELLRRYGVLHPKPSPDRAARLKVVREQLLTDGPEAVKWRKRMLALMGDVSPFMKLVNERFSNWFNRSHRRFGHLWAERYKSSLVEPRGRAVETVAAYIDLNCIRAGLAADPKDYRFCGYADAVAGHIAARRGLASINQETGWDETQAAYRLVLFGIGGEPREDAGSIAAAAVADVMKNGGRLPLAAVLRCRMRHFADGAVLGGKAYVETQLQAYRLRTGRRQRTAPRELPPWTDWGGLMTLRGLRRSLQI
jgi:hypothetical protein